MRTVKITFKTNLSTREINKLLSKIAVASLDLISDDQVEWTIKN